MTNKQKKVLEKCLPRHHHHYHFSHHYPYFFSVPKHSKIGLSKSSCCKFFFALGCKYSAPDKGTFRQALTLMRFSRRVIAPIWFLYRSKTTPWGSVFEQYRNQIVATRIQLLPDNCPKVTTRVVCSKNMAWLQNSEWFSVSI